MAERQTGPMQKAPWRLDCAEHDHVHGEICILKEFITNRMIHLVGFEHTSSADKPASALRVSYTPPLPLERWMIWKRLDFLRGPCLFDQGLLLPLITHAGM